MLFEVSKYDLPHRSKMSSFRRSHLVSYACLSILSEMSADWTSNPSSRSITESTLFTIILKKSIIIFIYTIQSFLKNFLIAHDKKMRYPVPQATSNTDLQSCLRKMSTRNFLYFCVRVEVPPIYICQTRAALPSAYWSAPTNI